MPLREIQEFLTRYLRNPAFRQRWEGSERHALKAELGLSDDDIALIEQIPMDDLERSAEGFRDDRLSKRRSEFSQFLDHLSLYGPVDEFLNAFDAAYPEGWEAQPLELDRFLSFGTSFVTNNGLPEYLISLLRFCYHYCKIAIAPTEIPDDRIENPRDKGIEVYHNVKLRQPYRVENFLYDALAIAMADPQPGESPVRQPTRLLFIKNQETFKRSIIWRVADLPPFVAALIDGPKALTDLLGPYDVTVYPQLVSLLLDFHDAGVVEFTTPPYAKA